MSYADQLVLQVKEIIEQKEDSGQCGNEERMQGVYGFSELHGQLPDCAFFLMDMAEALIQEDLRYSGLAVRMARLAEFHAADNSLKNVAVMCCCRCLDALARYDMEAAIEWIRYTLYCDKLDTTLKYPLEVKLRDWLGKLD